MFPSKEILYAGRIHPEKGIHLLIEAFVLAQAKGLKNWRLVVVGPWRESEGGGGGDYREKLIKQAQAAGGAVEFREPIFNESELVKCYSSAAIFVYPSLAERGETFGLAALEAMASGCVPVVSGLKCFEDFIVHGKNGLVFDHCGDQASVRLSEHLLSLTRDPDLLTKLRSAAFESSRGYALPVVTDRFLADFRAIVSSSA